MRKYNPLNFVKCLKGGWASVGSDLRILTSIFACVLTIFFTIPFAFSQYAYAAPSQNKVVNIRFAHYPDKLRIVIDLTAKTNFAHGFSPDRHSLILSLDDVDWHAPKTQNWKQMDPVIGYRFTQPSPELGRFEVLSRQALKILSLTTLPPDKDNKNFRIVVDLAGDSQAASAAPVAVPPAPPAPPPPRAAPVPTVTALPPPPPAPAPVVAAPPPPPPAPAPVAAAPPPPPPAPAPVVAAPPPPPPAPAPVVTAPPPPPSASAPSAEMIEEWIGKGAKLILENGPSPDYPQALMLFQRAADAGSPLAAFNLGEMYRTGKGVPQSFTTAAEWYDKASQKGFAPADYNLGALYYSGSGVPRDQQRALLLLANAAARGFAPAQEALDELKRKTEKPASSGGQ